MGTKPWPLIRVWDRIDKRGPLDCWPWLGHLSPKGYGGIRVRGKATPVHRLVYELEIGPVPTDMTIDHLCRNRACCNPAHLEPVPSAENVRRGIGPTAVNAQKETCPLGHPFDRTIRRADGRTYRMCGQCSRAALREYRRSLPRTPRPGLTVARKRAGLTQEQLSAAVGVAAPAVNRWEHGVAPIPANRRALIVAIIGDWRDNG